MSRIVLLHLDAGEDQRALVIDVLRRGEIGGRLAVADIGLVGLDADREEVLALVKHRHQDGVIGGVAVAAIGVVVEKGVALAETRVPLGHDGGLDVHAEDVDRHGLCRGQHLVVGGDDGAGEVPRDADDRRARAVQHGVGHLAADRIHAVGHDREIEGAELLFAPGRAGGGRCCGRCVVHGVARLLGPASGRPRPSPSLARCACADACEATRRRVGWRRP